MQVPALDPGDTVEVPRRPQVPGTYEGHDGIYVLGEVQHPGVYRLEPGNADLLGFILQAGGPTDDAGLENVLLLRSRPDGSLLRFEMDLASYLEEADDEHNPPLLAGDTVYVQQSRQISRILSSNITILTGMATLITSIVLLSTRSN